MGNAMTTPTAPPLTEENIGNHEGKVYMITGATGGIGSEVARILYAAHATVWITARDVGKGQQTIDSIKAGAPNSRGRLDMLRVDFNDLTTIKPAISHFLSKESKLNVLWNNAGMMIPPQGTITKQKYEAQLGVNAIAPFLFTKLLTDVIVNTAKTDKSARVVWVSSSAAGRFSPQGGVDMKGLGESNGYSQWQNYGMSKAASILQSREMARRYKQHGVISVSADPGNLDTGLYQNMPKLQLFFVKKLALKPAVFGAYTELFAGLGDGVKSGDWIIPWGQVATPRADIKSACLLKAQGGSGIAEEFWKWCEKETASYA